MRIRIQVPPLEPAYPADKRAGGGLLKSINQ